MELYHTAKWAIYANLSLKSMAVTENLVINEPGNFEYWRSYNDQGGYFRVSNLGTVVNCDYKGMGEKKTIRVNDPIDSCIISIGRGENCLPTEVKYIVRNCFIDFDRDKPFIFQKNFQEWDASLDNLISCDRVEMLKWIKKRSETVSEPNAKYKSVRVSDVNGRIIGFYESLRDCCEKTGYKAEKITEASNNRTMYQGYFWTTISRDEFLIFLKSGNSCML